MDNFHIKQPVLCTIFNSSCPWQLCEQKPPFAFLSDGKKIKEALPELLHALEVAVAQTSGLLNLDLSWQLAFSKCEYLFIDKPIQVITEPIEPSARPLGLGSKTISQQHAMHVTWCCRVRQHQVISKRKPLLAGGQQVLFLCWPVLLK